MSWDLNSRNLLMAYECVTLPMHACMCACVRVCMRDLLITALMDELFFWSGFKLIIADEKIPSCDHQFFQVSVFCGAPYLHKKITAGSRSDEDFWNQGSFRNPLALGWNGNYVVVATAMNWEGYFTPK